MNSVRLVSTNVGGVPVLVEAVKPPGQIEQTARGDGRIARTVDMVERSNDLIARMVESAAGVGKAVASRVRGPDQVEIQFGVTFSTEGDLVLAKATAEATLSVKVVFEREPSASEATAGAEDPAPGSRGDDR